MKGYKNVLLALSLTLAVGFAGTTFLVADETKDQGDAAPPAQPVATTPSLLDYLGDTKVISIEPVRQMFSHRSHVVEYKLACSDCHTDIFERKWGAARDKGDYTHADAFDQGRYCGVCHNGEAAFATVGEDNCMRCHDSSMSAPDTIYFQKPVRTVVFEHKGHVDMGLKCGDCHMQLFDYRVGAAEEQPEEFIMQALYDGKYCGACHNGEAAFASDTRCTTCHIGVRGDVRRLARAADKNKQNAQ
ncbi:MAG: c(7)-type cytochrome triheme domain-containing protein [Desulfobulbus sp.]|jgi:c(7)-type cytochrome triheme protein